MQVSNQPVLRDIVLIGGGHSHVGVLKAFAMAPEPGVRLTLICTDTHTPYSGMLPGYIAGHYGFDEVHIDLSRLAVHAGARLLRGEVTGLDRAQRLVLCRDRPPVAYDLASINIGATPQMALVPGAAQFSVPVKPIRQFNQRWLDLLAQVQQRPGPCTLAVVGGGAGGVEMALAMQYRLRQELQTRGHAPDLLQVHLFTDGPELLPTHNARVRRLFEAVLERRGVQVHRNAAVRQLAPGRLLAANGLTLETDLVLWVTQASAAPWLQTTGLALDGQGFVQVNDCLQTVDDPLVFATGDCARLPGPPLEKAGVFAVRQGMPLATNLRRSLRGEALRAYHPQRRWLALISTGDQHAVASRGALVGFGGDWVWRWKDWIDRGFMRRFAHFAPMAAQPAAPAPAGLRLSAEESAQAVAALAMRCGGCGAKVGASLLSRALDGLQPVERNDVLIGLHAPDDAAVLRIPPGKALVHSVDFFRAMVDDPYLFGRIAANHALGDIFAMGAEAQSASAILTVPPGLESKTEDLLRQLMAGALSVLNAAGCALVGGHTAEGQELAMGFAVNGLVDDLPGATLTKRGMRAGEVLVLTKPLGTGTLMAAHARLAAKGRWIDGALASMQLSSRAASTVLRQHGATACTDVTGFGLLGHLVEMARASGVGAALQLAALPLLEGAVQTVAQGILSSLQPANVRLRHALANQAQGVDHAHYALLFDPQTAGGLLASLPAAQAPACVAALHAAGYSLAAVIGQVEALPPEGGFIRLVA